MNRTHTSIARSRAARRMIAAAAAATAIAVAAATTASATTPHRKAYVVSSSTATTWMVNYLNAWETRDANAVEKIFTPNGVYQSIPGVANQTFKGRKAIYKYWYGVTRPQSQIHGLQGKPIVQGNRATIEIWVTFVDPVYNPKGNHKITLLEANVVTFAPSGLATKNVEYWNIIDGWHKPPPGWGS